MEAAFANKIGHENGTSDPVSFSLAMRQFKQREVAEKCGVFGVFGVENAAKVALAGIGALQHRGQHSAGISTSDGRTIHIRKKNGLVSEVFKGGVDMLPGSIAIAHNRYATSGGAGVEQAQPVHIPDVKLTLAHNGNLPRVDELKEFLSRNHAPHKGLSDSRMMAEAIAVYMRDGLRLEEAVEKAYPHMTGAFAFVAHNEHTLVGTRDYCGVRPLSIGKVNGSGLVFSSETCAFQATKTKYMADVRPGEMVVVKKDGVHWVQIAQGVSKIEAFEYVYFASPHSHIEGQYVYQVRKNFGRQSGFQWIERWGERYRDIIDIVVPIPDTADPMAEGFSEVTGIPVIRGIEIYDSSKRSYLEHTQEAREEVADGKFHIRERVMRGKKAGLMDDCIVHGTTSKRIVERVHNEGGTTEEHMIVGSPPFGFPEFYGNAASKQADLFAYQMGMDEERMRKNLGATSLQFLTEKRFIAGIGRRREDLSMPCFTGEYPIDIGDNIKNIQGLPEQNYVQPLIHKPFYERVLK